MSKRANEGFTKNAQRTKFVRNRDIKMKGSEIKKEEHMQKLMAEGVCRRCREKVQWRFRYDKYKPLKAPGNCLVCKQKSVTKAYRTMCDKCASVKKCCASCCGDLIEEVDDIHLADDSHEQREITLNVADMDDTKVVPDEAGNVPIEGEDEVQSGDDESVMGEEEDIEDNTTDLAINNTLNEIEEAAKTLPTDQDNTTTELVSPTEWDEKKFTNFASQKYNKNRVIGSSDTATITLSGL